MRASTYDFTLFVKLSPAGDTHLEGKGVRVD
jgi:hypothetical protein